MMQGLILSFFCIAFALLWNMYASWVDNSNYQRYDNPLFITMTALCCLGLSSIFKFLYMIQYHYVGYGFILLRIQAQYIGLIAQLNLCLIFLMLAYGYWTVQQTVGAEDFNLHKYILISACLAHMAIAFAMFTDHEERHKWHDYQGPQGIILCLIRIGIYGLFLNGVYQTWVKTQHEDVMIMNAREHRVFLQSLVAIGSLYFLSLPVSVWIANEALPGPSQQQFIVLSIYASQLTTIAVLLYQFAKQNSLYGRLSFKKAKSQASKSGSNSLSDINKLY